MLIVNGHQSRQHLGGQLEKKDEFAFSHADERTIPAASSEQSRTTQHHDRAEPEAVP
jgi:hypothetical protein